MGKLLKIHPQTPQLRQILEAVDILYHDGVIIYPTDSVYALGCSMNSKKALERLARFKRIDLSKAKFSFICKDLSNISEYTMPLDAKVFKLLKKNTPGPFTFILPASKKIPRMFDNSRKTVGLRIPDNNILYQIVENLGHPLLTTSIIDEDEIIEYSTDPELIWERYKNQVDLVIDGGYGDNRPTAVVDCTKGDIEIIREGVKDLVY
ncbi:MAG: threonylcarbamoyl-AMP synthase [Bacteroidales bacterium]|jgi:tRNA threonylcarbamoyl adenosine modification protein (Sua5/YciO/YrdC/YwlC family)|nr:threonylcarbamoyl-AMP synthase [Bacteroidales bacterium]